jgi:hypothetical protein
MLFKTEVYKVFIASPSEMADERKVVTEAVHDWNNQHATAESAVLLPVKWETHGLPQTGEDPQAAINRQLLGSSDILIAMFWTRLGTSTGRAASGTVEEINQFIAAGKPALLYFSKRLIDPSKIDPREQRRLRQFQKDIQKKALTGAFDQHGELRELLLRHLTQQIRELKSNCRSINEVEGGLGRQAVLSREQRNTIRIQETKDSINFARTLATLAWPEDTTESDSGLCRKLGRKYENVREIWPKVSEERTRAMEAITVAMRLLAATSYSMLEQMAKSNSRGENLVAITFLQVWPNPVYLDWLADSLDSGKHPFVGYHAALALLYAALNPSFKKDSEQILIAVTKAKNKLQDTDGPGWEETARAMILNEALEILETL